jgi:hypothetical protein
VTGVFDGTRQCVLDADRFGDEVALLTNDRRAVMQGAELPVERIEVLDPHLHVAHAEAGHLATGASDFAFVGLVVVCVGACRRILDLTLDHVRQRKQFARPLGSFQAVKYKAADMYVAVERACALTHFCALTIAEDYPRRTAAAHMAKAAAGKWQRVVLWHGLRLMATANWARKATRPRSACSSCWAPRRSSRLSCTRWRPAAPRRWSTRRAPRRTTTCTMSATR